MKKKIIYKPYERNRNRLYELDHAIAALNCDDDTADEVRKSLISDYY